jgi:hypothetical protein
MPNPPSISLNRFALYINSKSSRQREILYQRKYPDPDFNPGMYHAESRDAISKYLADGADDLSIIHNKIQNLKQIATDKVGTQRRINSNIDVLEKFLDMLDKLDFKGAIPSLGAHNPQKLTIHNLPVSVRPEIILRGDGPKGKKYIGAMKLQLSSANAFDAEMAAYASAALQTYCGNFLTTDGELVYPPYCQIIDVGSGLSHPLIFHTNEKV